jgi:hypothetical protein
VVNGDNLSDSVDELIKSIMCTPLSQPVSRVEIPGT